MTIDKVQRWIQAPDFSCGEKEKFSLFEAPGFICGVNPKSRALPIPEETSGTQRPKIQGASYSGGDLRNPAPQNPKSNDY